MHIDLAQIEDVHLMKNDSIFIDDIHLLLVFWKRLIRFSVCKP